MRTPRDQRRRRRVRRWMGLRPRTARELHRFVRVALGLDVPRAAPFEYLVHAFFEGSPSGASLRSGPVCEERSADCVVWANRGGGKTLLGAVATLLDLLFKPGVQVRILGGSLEQSAKMHAHLVALCDRPMVRSLLDGEPTQRRVRLVNGSAAEVLAQSQRSVRGVRVHKLRCDEVELFDPEVWQAAQLVTRSGYCGDVYVHGSVEALSTMHRPGGLMGRLVAGTEDGEGGGGSGPSLRSGPAYGGRGRRVFRWNYLDVIERCPEGRPCASCVLWEDCRGRAKAARGFMKVDDLVAQWQRSSRETWAAEMVCKRPRRSESVYPNFDLARHVGEMADGSPPVLIGGMDFGLRSPLVMLWAHVAGERLHVVDEYVEEGRTLEQHLHAIAQRGWARPAWVGVDPAGRQRNSHSGLTDIDVLRAHGYVVRARPSAVQEGIERLRRRFDRDTLRVHPRCVKLIEALRNYHFDHQRPHSEAPVKDGPDHACDALRYMVVNLERGPAAVTVARYV
ncbi:MAG: hypothetical protein ACODAQ_08300 [Phycisphaeraceae bacterium]